MDVYKVYNVATLHPILQKTFHYSVKGEYLPLLSNGDYATLLLECDIFTCVLSRSHVMI